MGVQQHNPLHPGEFIRSVYFEDLGLKSNQLARSLKVSPGLVSRLINGKVSVSSDMALRLSKVLGRSPESWLQMQANHDLWVARQKTDVSTLEKLEFRAA